jgi:signal recognition particle receptor subunit beta
LKEITIDNKSLRELEKVNEKTFDVEGIQLCETRKDTKVVIVDIPGINEADSSSKYRDYVEDRWDQFDCVILVMDARHGVNTEEQIALLEFIKTNLNERKDLPVIILFNKVDELDPQEEKEVIEEARVKIASLFEISSSKDIAQEIANTKNESKGVLNNLSKSGKYLPIFLPLSARNGYVYRLAPVVNQARFMELEKDLVEALGKEQIGLRQWNKLSEADKYKTAYEAISDPVVYKEGIRTSNFDSFLCILSHCIAGNDTQRTLIERQFEISLKSLEGNSGLAAEIDAVYEKMSTLGFNPAPLKGAFWKAYQEIEDRSLKEFPQTPDARAVPMKELIMYHQLTVKAKWADQTDLAMKRVKQFLNRFVDAALAYWQRGNGQAQDSMIVVFSFGQMLAMSSNQHFIEQFSTLKIILEVAFHKELSSESRCRSCKKIIAGTHHHRHNGICYNESSRCPKCSRSGFSGNRCRYCGVVFELISPLSKNDVHFYFEDNNWKQDIASHPNCDFPIIDSSPSEPMHFGHLFWLYCKWMESLTKSTSTPGVER